MNPHTRTVQKVGSWVLISSAWKMIMMRQKAKQRMGNEGEGEGVFFACTRKGVEWALVRISSGDPALHSNYPRSLAGTHSRLHSQPRMGGTFFTAAVFFMASERLGTVQATGGMEGEGRGHPSPAPLLWQAQPHTPFSPVSANMATAPTVETSLGVVPLNFTVEGSTFFPMLRGLWFAIWRPWFTCGGKHPGGALKPMPWLPRRMGAVGC